jgi:hypothetical protein
MKLSPKQVKELSDELRSLSRQQSTAFQAAVFLRMSREEAAQCDLRRARMTKISSLLFGEQVP